MLPRSFKHANKMLGAPREFEPDETCEEILVLPVWTDGRRCVSCWRPSWRERFSMLFFGQCWIEVHFGASQPPIAITGIRNYVREQKPEKLPRFSAFMSKMKKEAKGKSSWLS